MNFLAWIPSLIKKFIGYSCTLFLLGWGAYDRFENRLNANNEKVVKEMRIERSVEIGHINTSMALMQNDIGWIKTGMSNVNEKVDELLRRASK